MSASPDPGADPLRAGALKRLRLLSRFLAALLVATLLHIVVDGAGAQLVLATLITAAMLAGAVWLSTQMRRSERL